jgi:hypothetical protein
MGTYHLIRIANDAYKRLKPMGFKRREYNQQITLDMPLACVNRLVKVGLCN